MSDEDECRIYVDAIQEQDRQIEADNEETKSDDSGSAIQEQEQQIEADNEETKSDDSGSSSYYESRGSMRKISGVHEDKELLDKLKEEEENKIISNVSQKNKCKSQTRIKKLHEIMLPNESFREHYKPREMPFGPVHVDSGNLLKREVKLKLAAKFITYSGETGVRLLEKIKSNILDLKKCFSEQVIDEYYYTSDDNSLARLLFLDGCSILQFIYSSASGHELKEFSISNGQAALIQQDLFLLENQIPFRVLTLLIGLIKDKKKREMVRCAILKFVIMNNVIAPQDHSTLLFLPNIEVSKFFEENKPIHLLDILRTVILYGNDLLSRGYSDEPKKALFRMKSRHKTDGTGSVLKRLDGSQLCSFRNVHELKSAGIKLKPNESRNLLGISFITRFFVVGHLKLPPLIVDDSTARKLLNLVAYEMCFDDYKKSGVVTSYVNFLDLLIDNEQDVKELRAAHILRNRLSSDIDVARLFNDLGSNCLGSNSLEPPEDAYLKVKDGIQKHYERTCAIWVAQVYHDHFRSPWTVLALFAAIIALFLTATQTWYAIHPK